MMAVMQFSPAKQSGQNFPESTTGLAWSSACDQHGNIGAVENAARQIAHDVMAKQSPRLRRTGYDQIVIAVLYLREDLFDYDSMTQAHFRGNTEALEVSLLPTQIRAQLGF